MKRDGVVTGTVNLFHVNMIIRREDPHSPHPWRLRCGREIRDFLPGVESLAHLLAILGGREPVASGSEVLGNQPIGGEEPLGVAW